jgi:serine/threonine protein kinase
LREISIARELDSDYILKIYDVFNGVDSNGETNMSLVFVLLFLVSRYIVFAYGGFNLFWLHENFDDLQINDIRSILWQLLRGVEYLHESRVVHRYVLLDLL